MMNEDDIFTGEMSGCRGNSCKHTGGLDHVLSASCSPGNTLNNQSVKYLKKSSIRKLQNKANNLNFALGSLSLKTVICLPLTDSFPQQVLVISTSLRW